MNLPATAQSKVCSTCGIEKTAEHYHKESRNRDGLYKHCKPCRSMLDRVTRYNITTEEFKEMVRTTPHCPICGSEEPLVVDHDHCTSEVRGLICQPCNLLLGNARDNTETLRNAIAYLNNEPLREAIK